MNDRTRNGEDAVGEREVSVVLVDDDAIVRRWVGRLLEGSRFRIVNEAASALEACALPPPASGDLLLVDYRLRDGAGTDIVRALRRRGVATPAVIMTANSEPGLNEEAREAGAQGTLLKTADSGELLRTLAEVAAGRTVFDPRHPPRERGSRELSGRERELLRLVAGGATNREIAAAVGISEETVKTLLARARAKLGVRRRAEAVARAHARGDL